MWKNGVSAQATHSGAEVAWAEDMVYFARYKQSLELGWNICRSVGNMKVANAQHQHHDALDCAPDQSQRSPTLVLTIPCASNFLS